jgi:hypothetical protein
LQALENIIQELTSPLKTFRIFAIEKAIRVGKSAEILAALKEARQSETDGECQMLLEHAISSIEERLGHSHNQAPSYENEKVLDSFSMLQPAQQLNFIKKAPNRWFAADKQHTRLKKAIKGIKNQLVFAELLRKCMNFWPKELFNILEKSLFASSLALQLASLETIIQRTPQTLQKHFSRLILGKDPLIRALAIRGLAKTYPESAAEFLEDCLRQGDKYSKIAALRVCSVMPFELIKNSLLELVFSETDNRILNIASPIIIANPDKETPFRLCEQIVRTSGKRHDFLNDLLRKVCEVIKIAEICEDFRQFIASVKKHLNHNKARYFILNCASLYAEADPSRQQQLQKIFKEKCEEPVFAAVVKELNKTSPELLKDLLIEESNSQTSPETPSPARPQKDLLEQLNEYSTSDQEVPKQLIEQAFADGESELVSAAFRACKTSKLADRAKAAIKSDKEEIVAAAFEYLARFDEESFFLLVRNYINTESILIRTVLLRNLCQMSSQMARDLLSSMLNDSSEKVREKALASIIHFEFASIREILTQYLKREKQQQYVESCLSFYIANPMLESVYDLEKLRQEKRFSKLFKETQTALIDLIAELKIANPEEIHEFLQEKKSAQPGKTANEKAKKEEQLKKLKSKVAWQSFSEKVSSVGSAFASLKIGFAFILVAGIILFYITQGTNEPIETRTAQKTVPVAGKIQEFVLIVQKIDTGDGSVIGLDSGQNFIKALPRPGKKFVLMQGDKIRIRGLPFKQAPDGTLIVKTMAIKKE